MPPARAEAAAAAVRAAAAAAAADGAPAPLQRHAGSDPGLRWVRLRTFAAFTIGYGACGLGGGGVRVPA
jgi:hypothetical protein